MTSPAIHTHGLTYRWGAHGVSDLALAVPTGAIYAFIGRNGAGKTTTIRLLLGLLEPQAGRVLLHGCDLKQQRAQALSQVGALVESPSLYPHLSGRDNVALTATLLQLPAHRIDDVLEQVGLQSDARRKVTGYSLGMKQRLGLALALLPKPRVLLLDEPTNGLDPVGMAELRTFLRCLSDQGTTIFISSHLLGEVQQIATHVGLLDAGRLIFQGRLEALEAQRRRQLEIGTPDRTAALALLQHLGEDAQVAEGNLLVDSPRHAPADVNRALVEAGIAVHLLREHSQSLESLFLSMVEGPHA